MNVKPKFVYYDIRRKQSVCLIMYTHENDVDTQVLEVSMLDNGEPIELDANYTYSAAIVNRDTKALINDNISCELNDSGNVLIPIDNFHTLGAQDLLIELTITDSAGNQVLVTPFPLWIHVNSSILDDAQVTPESEGTVPELLEEAKEALENAGDYESLENKPQINGHELVGNKSSDDLGLQNKLTAGENITINANGEISASGGVTSYTELTDKPLIKYYRGNGVYSTAAFTGTLAMGISAPIVISKSGTAPNNEFYISLDSTQVFLIKTTTSYDVDTDSYSPFFLALSANRLSHLPSFVSPKIGTDVSLLNLAGKNIGKQIQLLFWRDGNNNPHCAFRVYGGSWQASWQELGSGSQIVSAAVNQDGTITFTMSDGSTVTTTGESVIGPQGPAGADGNDYVLTNQDKSDIADLVLAQLPTTQGVLYGD